MLSFVRCVATNNSEKVLSLTNCMAFKRSDSNWMSLHKIRNARTMAGVSRQEDVRAQKTLQSGSVVGVRNERKCWHVDAGERTFGHRVRGGLL